MSFHLKSEFFGFDLKFIYLLTVSFNQKYKEKPQRIINNIMFWIEIFCDKEDEELHSWIL